MIFQNPFDTLNPSHCVGSQIARVIRKFGVETEEDKVQARVMQLLDTVKLPRDFAKRRPRQLSGGQKQRIGIARAFAGNPAVVIADEPVSALDVSVQAAVTELLMDIQRDHRTTLLFISHDLSVVRYLADRMVVMYLGQIMEQGTTDEIFCPALSSLYRGAAFRRADRRHAGDEAQGAADGRNPLPLQPAAGLPLLDALPLHDAGHLRRDPAARRRAVAGAPHPVPPAACDARGDGAGDHDGDDTRPRRSTPSPALEASLRGESNVRLQSSRS